LITKNSEFDYHMNDDLGRMVLNQMWMFVLVELWRNVQCVFKWHKRLLNAKTKEENCWWRIQTACSNACSTGAMKFGDKW
jgi:molybdopterin-containing oxidoreductase family iron-sulfur binding subunit